MDKTGTLTKGDFKVQQVVPDGIEVEELKNIAAAIEKNSTHPIARAVTEYADKVYEGLQTSNIEEVSGYGLKGTIGGKNVLVGNLKLLKKYNIDYP